MAVNDGSANASAGSPQYSSLLDSYGANRPAWEVAGVDYHVGVPAGLALKDPATISMAGVSINTTTKIVTVTGDNVTLSGYDFSLNGGWEVSVQAANTTITNSNFLIGSNNLAPIVSTAAASNMTVSYCTIDGAGKDPGWGGLISYRGNGFTVEQSWLKNAGGDMIQQIDGGANSTVVIQHNLIENGGLASGAHGDYTQLAGGPFNVEINYNTTIQNGGTTQGLMTEYVASGEIGNNTMVGNPSYFVSVDNSSIKTTVTVHDNYYDAKGYGFVYPNSGPDDGNPKSIYIHNVNMKTGAVLQDSDAPASSTPTAPSAPTIASFSNDTGVAGDKITADNTLTLTGTAAANSTVKVFDGTTQIGTATANASGAWSYTTSALADGSHSLTAKVTDASGNTSSASTALAVKIDTTAPAVPVALNDTIVNGNQVLLNGTAEANSTVKVYDGLTLVGTTTAKADGTWSVTTSALSQGSHDLTATATDVAGNTSAISAPLDPIIGGAAPSAPVIASYSNDSGVAGDGITNDNTLTLTGTAAANSTVKVFDGATQIGTVTANASGAWSYTTAALPDGSHNLTAKAMDAAGNTSAASAGLVVNVAPATTTPASGAPAIVSFSNDSGVAGDGITNDNTLTLTGTAKASGLVLVYDGAVPVGSTIANSSGAWSFTTSALANGSHSLTVKAIGATGQFVASSALNVKIDTVAPTAPVIATSSASTGGVVNLAGTAEANSTVKVYDGTTQIGTATADSKGAWSLTTGALATGNHSFTATAADVAGNTGAASKAIAVSVAAPTAPATPDAPKIASYSTDSGVAGDGITNDNAVTLTGTAAANSTVKVFDGATQIGTATANASGAWSYTTAALADGDHSLTAKVMNGAGNSSAASSALALKIDTVAPDAPKIAAGEGTVNADHVTLTGSAEANSKVMVFDGAKQLGIATADSKGAWTYAADSLSDGSHSFTTKAMDAAGNTSGSSSAFDVKIDTHTAAAPSAEFTNVVQNWNHTVTFKGTADPFSQINIYDNGSAKALGSVQVGSDGTWSYKTSSAVSNAVHNFTATVTDQAGNTSAVPGSAVLGTNGNNVLTGTSGNDLFKGNGGQDTFVFTSNFGADVISDFSPKWYGHDVVQFSKSVFDNFADVLAHAAQSGQDVVIDAGGGNTLTLKDTKLATLDKTDFHFA